MYFSLDYSFQVIRCTDVHRQANSPFKSTSLNQLLYLKTQGTTAAFKLNGAKASHETDGKDYMVIAPGGNA